MTELGSEHRYIFDPKDYPLDYNLMRFSPKELTSSSTQKAGASLGINR